MVAPQVFVEVSDDDLVKFSKEKFVHIIKRTLYVGLKI
jgi:hypothetical protein